MTISIGELLKQTRAANATQKRTVQGSLGRFLLRKVLRIDERVKKKYFLGNSVCKLHLGCGKNILNGWLNADLFPRSRQVFHLDATIPFPFDSNSFDYIYSEHMLEHLTYSSGMLMLSESFRILKPNGALRIATPDMAFLENIYRFPDDPIHKAYIEWSIKTFVPTATSNAPIFVLNNFVRDWGHCFIYDEQLLSDALIGVGFTKATRVPLNKSDDLELSDLANEARMPEGFLGLETMVFEAKK